MLATTDTSSKGHASNNTIKRHGLRVKNSVSSCPKSLWIIGFVIVVILITISITAVHFGQDLINALADKHSKESNSNSNSPENVLNSVKNPELNEMHIYGTKKQQLNVYDNDDEIYQVIDDTEQQVDDIPQKGYTGNRFRNKLMKPISKLQSIRQRNKLNLIKRGEEEPVPDDNNIIEGKTTKLNQDGTVRIHGDLEDHSVEDRIVHQYKFEKKKRSVPQDAKQHPSQKKNTNNNGVASEDAITKLQTKKEDVDDEDKHFDNENDKSFAAEDHKKSSKSSSSSSTSSYESAELTQAMYKEYYNLPTFFDIDPVDDNYVDLLVKYWKKSGKSHYNKYTTKYREIQKDDLKKSVMVQDEVHNKKLNYIYNINNKREHAWNIDYDYLYPYMYTVGDYDKDLISKTNFAGNVTKFLDKEILHAKSRYIPRYDIYEMYSSHNIRYQRLMSKEASYDKHEKYLRDNYQDIELIFPENDTLLFALMYKFGLKVKSELIKEEKKTEKAGGGYFLRSLKYLEDKDSSSRRRLEGFDILNRDSTKRDINKIKIDSLGSSTKADIDRPKISNFNGLTSDISYYHRNRSSISYYHNLEMDNPQKLYMSGNMDLYGDITEKHESHELKMYENNRFWRLQDHCIRRKSIVPYPNWRILYKSKPLTCDIILQHLIDPISKCLFERDWKCPLLIDHGYFRFVFKSEAKAKYLYSNPSDPEEMIPIVLKVMKTQFVDWSNDWMRHIREAIFLQQLQRWENEFMNEFGPQFQSEGRDRAFYFVPELGHCLYPTYITVTPFYDNSLKDWVRHDHSAELTLKEATRKSLEILSGLQVMHNIEGGPYAHTDLQPRQFMVDSNDNILINDFNRGKFTEYYFKKAIEGGSSDVIIPCTYCMPWSHGHYRAPEEYYSDPIDEALDMWSICLTVWHLFSYEKPWSSISNNYEAIKYLLHDFQMKPKFSYSVPPYLKDLFRQCWRQDITQRIDINELTRSFRYFYKHIHRLSDGKEKLTLNQLRESKAYKETNYPDVKELKENI